MQDNPPRVYHSRHLECLVTSASPFRRGDKGVAALFFQTYCTRLTAPLSGCFVVGTACRPVRPSGHSPGERIRVMDHKIAANSDERSVERSVRSGTVQPVMRSLRRYHGRLIASSPRGEIRETVRSMVNRQQYPENRGPAERRPPPNAVRASPKRSDTRTPVNPREGNFNFIVHTQNPGNK